MMSLILGVYFIGCTAVFMILAHTATDSHFLFGVVALWPLYAVKHIGLALWAGLQGLVE